MERQTYRDHKRRMFTPRYFEILLLSKDNLQYLLSIAESQTYRYITQ